MQNAEFEPRPQGAAQHPAAIYGRFGGCAGWGVRACAQLRAQFATYRVLVLAQCPELAAIKY